MHRLLLPCFLISLTIGCGPSQDTAPSSKPIVIDEMPPSAGSHAHPENGPHGGELVELGNEAYHIEMVHEDSGANFYVLDGSAMTPVAIAATNLVLSLKLKGEQQSFELLAVPEATDQPGKASRFQSDDHVLTTWLEAEAEGVIVVQIDGRSFTGKIAHHDH